MDFKDYIIWEEMYKYYGNNKPFKFLEFKDGASYEIKKKRIDPEDKFVLILNCSYVFVRCYYCKKVIKLTVGNLKNRLRKRWLSDRFCCIIPKKNRYEGNCSQLHQQDINAYRTSVGKSSAQGHTVTKEQIGRRVATIKKRYPDGIPNKRKSKSFKDQYGEQRAEEIIDKIKYYRNNFQISSGMKGKHHKLETIEKIRIKRKKWREEEDKKGAYIPHPETGELLTQRQYQGVLVKTVWGNLSEEEKLKRIEKIILRKFKNGENRGFRSKVGYINHWDLKKDQRYESSFEEAYFKLLNNEKIFWEKNNKIYIPYFNPIKNEKRYYIPDVLIFSDRDYKLLKCICEVKPSSFLEKYKESNYGKICVAKINALRLFCELNKIEMKIITEKDLGVYLENKKNNKKSI